MKDVLFRWLSPEEVTKIGEIDRSERIRTGYRYYDGQLQRLAVNWDSPPWKTEGDDEYSVAAQINFCREHIEQNGRLYGAFADGQLAGIGVITPGVAPDMAQLAYLHVSRDYRRQGLAAKITDELIREARRSGAGKLYVSATPSGSAVGFYLSRGFVPTETPIAALFEREPDDIHMVMTL